MSKPMIRLTRSPESLVAQLIAANARIARLRADVLAWRDVRKRGNNASTCRAVATSEAVDQHRDLEDDHA